MKSKEISKNNPQTSLFPVNEFIKNFDKEDEPYMTDN